MHDLLKFYSWLQALHASQGLPRIILYIGSVILTILLWNQTHGFAQAIAFVAVTIGLYFAMLMFLSDPIELLRYICLKVFFLALSIVRISAKIVLVTLASILSLIYFLMPIDIIPDILLGIGWIEDILIAIGLVSYAASADVTLPEKTESIDTAQYPELKRFIAAVLAIFATTILRVIT